MQSFEAVISHNVVSLRAKPSRDSEQLSQAILGDRVTVLEEAGDYARVRMADRDEGWILRRYLLSDAPSSRQGIEETLPRYQVVRPFAPLLARPTDRFPQTQLVIGTWVQQSPRSAGLEDGWLRVRLPAEMRAANDPHYREGYLPREALRTQEEQPDFHGRAVCVLARAFVGTPYLWGGTTPFGFDCSGFVQRLYSLFGVLLPRDSYLQARSDQGRTLAPNEERQAGDLVFFCADYDPRGHGITHVGMALGRRRFIHASGKEGVAITPLDDPYYTRTYRSAWRLAAHAAR